MSITREQLLQKVNEFNSLQQYDFTIVQTDKFVDEHLNDFEHCAEGELLDDISASYEYYCEKIAAKLLPDSDEIDFSQYS